jgi:hypothetical protein
MLGSYHNIPWDIVKLQRMNPLAKVLGDACRFVGVGVGHLVVGCSEFVGFLACFIQGKSASRTFDSLLVISSDGHIGVFVLM